MVDTAFSGSVRKDYENICFRVGDDSGKRHLTLANTLEDKRIFVQAMEQFQLAAERAVGPKQALAKDSIKIMTNRGVRLKETYYHYPNKKERERYRDKAYAEHRRDRKGWKKLADFCAAHPKELLNEALEWYGALISDSNDLLEFDSKGRIVLPEGTIPSGISTMLGNTRGTVTIESKTYLRDGLLQSMAEPGTLYMTHSDSLRVLSQNSALEAADLHDMGETLLARLKKDIGKGPGRHLTLLVFSGIVPYVEFCNDSNHSPYGSCWSFIHREEMTAIICSEEVEGEKLTHQILCGLVLRELSQLYHYAVNGVEMPPWYLAGLAESYGGEGAFEWTKGRLTIKGKPASARLEALKNRDGPIDFDEQLFKFQVNQSWHESREYYALAWLFMDYLNHGASKQISSMVRNWEEYCFSRNLDSTAVEERFHGTFLREMPNLQKGLKQHLDRM